MTARTLPLAALLLAAGPAVGQTPLPTPEAMAAAKEDVWGEAAIRAPGGPSYEFFKDLLPPLRYVNTAFKHYPIVLSAPGHPVKARWVSNGGGVNLRADKPPMWKEAGTPVAFFVGEKEEPFGQDAERLIGPYQLGRPPEFLVGYSLAETRYEQYVFAAVGTLAEHGTVIVNLRPVNNDGRVTARIGTE